MWAKGVRFTLDFLWLLTESLPKFKRLHKLRSAVSEQLRPLDPYRELHTGPGNDLKCINASGIHSAALSDFLRNFLRATMTSASLDN